MKEDNIFITVLIIAIMAVVFMTGIVVGVHA